jgi:hypothetical protein
MASRQEEKEQRRREREEAEAIEARSAARVRRLQMVFGGILALVLIVGVGYAIVSGGGGNGEEEATEAGQPATPAANAELPEPSGEKDPAVAAKAAGCELIHAKYEGAGHEERTFKASDYQTNPPTSGAHFPEWYDDGVYKPGETSELGKTVHTLEHGRINVQYRKGTDATTVKQLEAFLAEKTGYHLLLYENGTNMPYAVAATAWTQLLGCNEMNDKVFDALRAFYDRYVDKGPEQVP